MTTATATPPARHRTESRRQNTLAGTGTLLRFILRRDRIRVPVWIVAITGMTLAVNASWQDLYGTREDLEGLAHTLNSPAMIAMTGHNYAGVENVTYGSLMSQQMLWFTLIGVGLMSILLFVRHTRAEEEAARAELVRANVVGRHAYMTAAFLLVGIANVVVGLITAVGLGAMGVESMDWAGSWLYGAAHVAVGMAFAAVAAVTVQISQHSRGAAGLALAVLGAAYALRAMGDVGENGINWLSPIGWGQETRVYVENRWWPLLVAVAVTVALAWCAYFLSTRRDVGQGLRATRPGSKEGSRALTTPFGFAVRLHRGLLIGFGIAMLLLGVSYGSIMGDVEQLLEDIDVWQEMIQEMAGSVVEAFGSTILVVLAMISSIYVVLAMQRARSEETSGRAEPLLSTAVSRSRWLGTHVTVAVLASVVMLLLVGLGFGGTSAAAAEDSSLFGPFVGAALAFAPSLWLTIGVAVALFGWLPRATALTWIVPIYGVIVIYLGGLLDFPDWMNNLSPFGHVPQMPSEEFELLPLAILTVIAAGLIALGMYGFRQRDLETK